MNLIAKKESQDKIKLNTRLKRETGKAISDYEMIHDGDKIMVCLSGGKDSYTLLNLLMQLKRNAPIDFELIAVNLDQKQPGFPEHILPEYLKTLDIPFQIVEEDTYTIVKDVLAEGKTMCSLCSRLRRGNLYRIADELGATKIALGHHREDIIETFFLNLFFGGKTSAMPPKLLTDDKKHIVIRPLAYCKEKDIQKYADYEKFPIIPCNLCGSQPNLQRKIIKNMLGTWDKDFPGRIETIFTSLQNIKPSQMCDSNLFDFKNLMTQ